MILRFDQSWNLAAHQSSDQIGLKLVCRTRPTRAAETLKALDHIGIAIGRYLSTFVEVRYDKNPIFGEFDFSGDLVHSDTGSFLYPDLQTGNPSRTM